MLPNEWSLFKKSFFSCVFILFVLIEVLEFLYLHFYIFYASSMVMCFQMYFEKLSISLDLQIPFITNKDSVIRVTCAVLPLNLVPLTVGW